MPAAKSVADARCHSENVLEDSDERVVEICDRQAQVKGSGARVHPTIRCNRAYGAPEPFPTHKGRRSEGDRVFKAWVRQKVGGGLRCERYRGQDNRNGGGVGFGHRR